MAYDVAQRQKEIGVRLASGAEGRDVARMVLRHFLALTIIGLGLGCVGIS